MNLLRVLCIHGLLKNSAVFYCWLPAGFLETTLQLQSQARSCALQQCYLYHAGVVVFVSLQ